MISVGIDVSKGKSVVCILKPYGEIVKEPFEVSHTKEQLEALATLLKSFEKEVRVVCEATGIYHEPVVESLHGAGIFVSVVNPLTMKKYGDRSIRKVKTDKADAIKIASYGIDYWFNLASFQPREQIYTELQLLNSSYEFYLNGHTRAKVNLSVVLEKTMPGITSTVCHQSNHSGDAKLGAIVSRYWHYDNITKLSERRFVESFCKWAKKQRYQQNEKSARRIYALASAGIPSLSSSTPSTKMIVQEAVNILLEYNRILARILSQMQALASTLREYDMLLAMPGIGKILASRLIASIGDVRRFHSGSALVAQAGIDIPSYQSGQYTGTQRKISKRGTPAIRKTAFQIVSSMLRVTPKEDNAVYEFVCKKLAEGKPRKVAKVAGINKLLRIYYARASELYS